VLIRIVASSAIFSHPSHTLTSYNSEADLITTPLFFVIERDVPTGLISIAKAGLPLVEGNLNRNIPAMLVSFLYQFLPSLRNCMILSSAPVMVVLLLMQD
jgi:hypothetical protein